MKHVSAKSLYEAYNEAHPNAWKSWNGGDVPRWEELALRKANGDGAAHQVIMKWIAVAAVVSEALEGTRIDLAGIAKLFGVDTAAAGDEWPEALEGAVNDHFARLIRVAPPERLHKLRSLIELANFDDEIERELACGLDTLLGEIGRLENQSEARRQTLVDANAQIEALKRERDHYKAEAQRWGDRNRELENRAHHATDVLRGSFAPPTIDELRDLRGLEALAPWETVATPFVPPMRDTGDLPVLTPVDFAVAIDPGVAPAIARIEPAPIEVVEIARPHHHTDVSDLSVDQGDKPQ